MESTLTTTKNIRNRPMRKPRTSHSVPRRFATLADMWLVCSQRCGGTLFRALNAEVEVDAAGAYQAHRVIQAGYLCLNCGSPAMDLGAVPEAMEEEEAEDDAVTSL